MTHFRLRFTRLGGHVHVNVWSGTERETTHGLNGKLIFREEEWEAFQDLVKFGVSFPSKVLEILEESVAHRVVPPDELVPQEVPDATGS